MSDIVSITSDLTRYLSPGALLSDPTELPAYGSDFWGQRGTPGVVVRAAHTQDIVETLRYAAARGIPVIPRAAGTNGSAGFLPTSASILLDLRRLNRVRHIDPELREAIVEPGVLNGDLQAQLAPLGFRYSPDPASAPISTIGGNIAENAGGPRCLKYGVTFHHVHGVECVLANGDILQLNALDAGPDLLGVIIGSEGTLGVVTQARLKLNPLPQATRTLLASFDQPEKAATLVSSILATGILPATIEYLDQQAIRLFESYAPTGYPFDAAVLIIDVDGSPEEVEHDIAAIEHIVRVTAREVRRADDEATRLALWRGRLQAGQALAASGKRYYICDTTVPRSRIPDMQHIVQQVANRHNLSMLMIGHAGDGNVHPVILYDGTDTLTVRKIHLAASEIIAATLEIGGTITGEHGVGSEKIPFMRQRLSAAEISAMRVVKRAFDPSGILNPGILFPEPTSDEPSLPRMTAAMQSVIAARRSNRNIESLSEPRPSPWEEEESSDGIELDAENLTVCVQANVPIRNLRNKLAGAGYHSPALQDIHCDDHMTSVREMLSEQRYRKAVRDTLLEVDVTLVDNIPARFGSNVVKDVAGYDMKRLFVGSGSIFGVIEKARFQIRNG